MNTPTFRNTLIAVGIAAALGLSTGALAQSSESADNVQPTHTHLSSDLIGATVKHSDEQNQTARLRHLVIDDTGSVTHAILGYGGTLGVGEKQFMVPFSELSFTKVDKTLTVSTTLVPEEVRALPEFRTLEQADTDAEKAAKNRMTGTVPDASKSISETVGDATRSTGAALGEASAETQRVASDSWITTKIKSVIYADDIGQGYEVSVTTLHGAVTLTGVLADQQSIDHVTGLAEGVEGVNSVDASTLTIQ